MKIKSLGTGELMVNTYYVADEMAKKGFIVDPGGYSEILTDAIRKDDISIEYIILTHGHSDHIGGVKEFMRIFPRAKLVAAEAEAPMLEDPVKNMSSTLGRGVALTADISVKEGDILKVGGLELKFVMTPGHTPGGMCILVGGAVFSGDTLFHSSIGRTDFPGGSFEQLKNSVHQKLFVLPDDTDVYPGHMGPTTIGFEKRNNPFV